MNGSYFENEEFNDIKLDGEVLSDYEFVDCDFTNCSLENCKLIGCSFTSCTFGKCNVSNLTTQSSTIRYAEFSNCNLVGIDWSALNSMDSISEPISKLQSSYLKYNTFSSMTFRKIHFTDSTLQDSVFSDCDLVECSFKKCTLDRTEFFKCDLRKADFRDATGYQIDITTSKIKGAQFSYPEAINLLNCLDIKIE
jgi:fluoroquinolone resistance protein